MYVFKNALKSITRTKSRNILIALIVVVLAASCCVALSIKNSATNLIQSYEDSYEVEAWLGLNRQEMRFDMNQNKTQGNEELGNPQDFMKNIAELDVSSIKTYGDSEYVKSYYYTIQTNLNGSGIEKVSMEDSNVKYMTGGIGKNGESKNVGDFSVVGYSSLDAMTNFVNGTYKITTGEMFDPVSNDNNCVISEELAEQNELSIGDKITLVNPNKEEKTYEFIITGIYSDNSESSEFSMFSNAANQILTSYNALNAVVENSSQEEESTLMIQTDARFKLVSTDVIEAFSKELTEKGLSSYYTVSTNLDSLESTLKPIQNLSTFATTFLIIVLAIGGAILVIINMINIRERKYEIGVLRSIGMKKHMVLGQFVIETFMVTLSGIIIGAVIGSTITVPVANKMLESEITSMEEETNEVNSNFGFSAKSVNMTPGANEATPGRGKNDIKEVFGGENVSYVDKLNAIIDVKTIVELILIGVLLTIISSSVSMVFISRYSPLKILSSRT
ncbi:MAG: ABC transporter permease [Clostridia bacterium]|nr:ABC transporter permease [Clostridia bacterium]